MKGDLHLERRMQKDLIVSEDVYIGGLFDIIQWLVLDLEGYCKDENRYFGVMLSYFKTMRDEFSRFNMDCDNDLCTIYGKIFYLYKPIVVKEFGKLETRKLSQADRIIVMIKRILDMLEEEGSIREYKKLENIKNVNIIITKMFDRIRNDGKKAGLNYMIKIMRQNIDTGKVGKISVDEYSMKSEVEKRKSYLQPVKDDGIIMEETKGTTVWNG
jgi:hypothetical protein